MDLEEVFCSKTRMRLLKMLFDLGQLNISDLARRLGTNYSTTLQHLTLLKKEGVVTERRSGRKRFFRFSKTLKAQAVMKLLVEWDN